MHGTSRPFFDLLSTILYGSVLWISFFCSLFLLEIQHWHRFRPPNYQLGFLHLLCLLEVAMLA